MGSVPILEVSEDVGLPVVECLFTRASDSVTMGLHVRTSNGYWFALQYPSAELAAAIQRGVSDPHTQVRAYHLSGQDGVGIIIRCFRPS